VAWGGLIITVARASATRLRRQTHPDQPGVCGPSFRGHRQLCLQCNGIGVRSARKCRLGCVLNDFAEDALWALIAARG
jgi:hypothetical protein